MAKDKYMDNIKQHVSGIERLHRVASWHIDSPRYVKCATIAVMLDSEDIRDTL
jgi:hypothetical protein